MKKYHIISGGIDSHSISDLAGFLNNNDGELAISLNSTGGDGDLAVLAVKMLNENSDRIELIMTTGCYSAAFKIFAKFKGKRSLVVGATGMFHYSFRQSSIDERKKIVFLEERALAESSKQAMQSTEEFASLIMNDTEFAKFKKGKSVYFTFNRMKELFPDAEILE